MENYEISIEHIQADINRDLFSSNIYISAQVIHSANKKVSEN